MNHPLDTKDVYNNIPSWTMKKLHTFARKHHENLHGKKQRDKIIGLLQNFVHLLVYDIFHFFTLTIFSRSVNSTL